MGINRGAIGGWAANRGLLRRVERGDTVRGSRFSRCILRPADEVGGACFARPAAKELSVKAKIHPKYQTCTFTARAGTRSRRAARWRRSTSTSARLPPVLHRQAEVRRHRRPRGAVQQEVRRDLQLPEDVCGCAGGRRGGEVTLQTSLPSTYHRRPPSPRQCLGRRWFCAQMQEREKGLRGCGLLTIDARIDSGYGFLRTSRLTIAWKENLPWPGFLDVQVPPPLLPPVP